MEKDYEQREGKFHQEYIRREAELQKQIDERDQLYDRTRQTIEMLELRNAFDKLKIIRIANKKVASDRSNDAVEMLQMIYNFIRGSSLPLAKEV